ncbi:hypothetical protein MSG28_002056 [Choristoneura fumiferana]|uniref:Uncharacterized protein n=1 Tax=Choristoneura fumiferana TaxID=7141 RepID=A0ACC0JU94_CHOFU|nr:hypothetical protein MSG28_002056 [Choristoneura fumiferana]
MQRGAPKVPKPRRGQPSITLPPSPIPTDRWQWGGCSDNVIKNNLKVECKCHGLSGSCTLRTCWWRMPTFREIGDKLRDKFEGAAKVIASNDGDSFMPESPSIKRPGKKDIIYSEESPDFCSPNMKTGSLGTEGRQCNVSSAGTDSCDQLCCRRGYEQRTIRETENCNCQFKWCCEVICETCYVNRDIQTCH